MKKTSILKRMLISVLAIAMVLTAIPMTTVTAQAAPTAVKKVVIKQGKKNVTKKTIKLAVGKSSKIKVVVKPSKAKKSIKYVSGNKKVATVSKSGKIKAKAAGTTKIKVTVTGKNKKKKTTWVKVKVTGGKTEDTPSPQPSNSPAPSQAPAPQPAPAMVNGSVQLPIANATSSDPSIATVDATGKVTAGSKAGTVTISGKDARGNDISYTVTVTEADVQAAVAASSKVKVNIAKTDLVVGESIVATTDVVPAGDSIIWSSSDASVATVDASGQIVAIAAGSTRVTATSSRGASDSVTITVKAVAVTGIEIEGDKDIDLVVGGKTILNAKVLPENATDRRYEYSVDKENVVTISALGEVTAVNEGTVTVTAKTKDGGFAVSWVINVTQKVDPNKITATLTVNNEQIAGQADTVLTGDTMKVTLTAKKGTQPYSGTVGLTLEPISGYDYYGFVNNKYDSIYSVTTGSDGTVSFNIALNDQKYKDADGDKYDATIDKITEYGFEDAAFASYKLKADVDGSTVEKSIVFAQVMTATEYGFLTDTNTAITVNNGKEIGVPAIKRTSGELDTQITTVTDRNNKTYKEEYVVSQQESFDDEDRHIELDASPLLIVPEKAGDADSGYYGEKDKPIKYDYTSDSFSVYSSFENAKTLQNVPGGLKALNLKFGKLDIGDYTRLVIRCYYADTNIPYTDDDGNYLEETLTSKNKITAGHDTVTLKESIFNSLKGEKYIDVKIFVESAGQVDNKHNSGFTLVSGYGEYRNETSIPYDIVKLSGCVEWKIQEPEMSMKSEMTPTQARQLLGDKYNSEYTYDMSVPAGQETGNAFIYVSANGKDKDPFAYPSIAEENANILYSEKYPIKQEYLLTDTTNKMVQPLSEKEYTISYPEDGDICINAKTAGYMQIGASINVADKVKYNVHSSIQWCPAPSEREITSTQFYAVAGETVKLTAKVTSKNATNVKDVGVNWEYDSNEITVDDAAAYKTNADGEVTILLKATKAFDLGLIRAELADGFKDNYNIKWYVAGQEMTTDVADIYWVMPGIYYDNSALKTGDEYYTNQAKEDVAVNTNSYTADSEWLLGVKVVGTGTDDQVNRDDEFYVEHDITISNIGLRLDNESTSIAPDADTQVKVVKKNTGTWLLTNAIKGGSKETISVTGKADNTKPCIITIDGVAYTSAGMLSEDNNIAIAKNLIIPITWGVTEQQILSIETPSGNTFNVANTKDPVVYFKVVDNSTAVNPVAGVEVSYTLKDDKGNEIKKATVPTNEKGIYELRLTDDIRPDVDIEEDATWTLSATIKEEEPIQKNIIFKVNDNTTFELKKVESSGTDKKVTVTFENGRISTTDAVLPSMFELKDENNDIVKVVKVEKDAYNSNVLILTTDKTFTGDISCTINNEVVDDATGYTVQLLDSVGHLFQTNANKALNVQNLETSVSDDDVSEEYEELEEIEF